MQQLINESCTAALTRLKANTVQLTVTSPPYDNLRTYNGNNADWNETVWQACIVELYRVTKPGGVVVWIVNDATINGSETGTSFQQALWAKACGFNLHDTMIYYKGCMRFPDQHRYYNSFEYMFVWSKGQPSVFTPIADRPNKRAGETKTIHIERQCDGSVRRRHKPHVIGKYGVRFNVWYIPTGHNKSASDPLAHQHPAIFPEALVRDHIVSWSKRGQIVLDPFMGSGTTGKMARNGKAIYRD